MSETQEQSVFRRKIPLYTYIVLADSYGMTTLILISLWLITGERLSFVRVFINLLPPLLLPAFLALPIGILLRKWRPVVLVLPAFIAFLILYGTAFIPKSTPDFRPNLTVLTYNMHAHNTDEGGVAALIRESDADFVSVQEMRPDMFDFLEQTFQDDYPYIVVRESKGGAILMSRHPMRDNEAGTPDSRFTYAIVDFNGQDILVNAVHLPVPLGGYFSTDVRSQRMDDLLDFAAGYDMPQIFMGDFNTTDATQDYRRFASQYTDVFRQTRIGLGTTFPNWTGINRDIHGFPSLIRLDYVFISSEIIAIDAQVMRQGLSDHYALIAHLYLEER